MNITFLIGNGFDLKMGMKTRYVDVYDSYIQVHNNDKSIAKFKKELKDNAPDKYTKWSDFERQMGCFAPSFENENEFIKCVRDFRRHMIKHLREEEKNFIDNLKNHKFYEAACSKVMNESIYGFYKGQIPSVIHEIESLYNTDIAFFSFITFNYTKIFDAVLNAHSRHTKMSYADELIHIHGKLDEDIVLGVDNFMQIEKGAYLISKRTERAFVKPVYNNEYDYIRVERAKKMIEHSDIVCVYGLSLGITDKMWIEEIKTWLLENESHHLIFFQYSENMFDEWNGDEKMDEEEVKKEELLKRLFDDNNIIEQIYKNVHIPIGFDIFNLHSELEKYEKRILPQTMGSMIN